MKKRARTLVSTQEKEKKGKTSWNKIRGVHITGLGSDVGVSLTGFMRSLERCRTRRQYFASWQPGNCRPFTCDQHSVTRILPYIHPCTYILAGLFQNIIDRVTLSLVQTEVSFQSTKNILVWKMTLRDFLLVQYKLNYTCYTWNSP